MAILGPPASRRSAGPYRWNGVIGGEMGQWWRPASFLGVRRMSTRCSGVGEWPRPAPTWSLKLRGRAGRRRTSGRPTSARPVRSWTSSARNGTRTTDADGIARTRAPRSIPRGSRSIEILEVGDQLLEAGAGRAGFAGATSASPAGPASPAPPSASPAGPASRRHHRPRRQGRLRRRHRRPRRPPPAPASQSGPIVSRSGRDRSGDRDG